MALNPPVVQNRKSSTTPPGTPPPSPDPVQDANRARIRARFMEEQRRNAEARRLALSGGSGGNPDNGKYAEPSDPRDFPAATGRVFGGGPKNIGAHMTDTYDQNIGNMIDRTPAPLVPVDPTVGGQSGGTQNQGPAARNRNPNRQQPAGQITQEAAQALYNDTTIPHEFKGQLMELARSGNAQSFAQTLFGSGLPHETKLRLMQLFGFGGGAASPAPTGGPQGQPQGAPQPAPQNPVVPNTPPGSPYYGAF